MSEPSRETSGRRIWSRRRRGDHPAGVIPHQSYQDPGPPGPGFFRRGGETVSRTAAVRRKKAWEHPEDVPTPLDTLAVLEHLPLRAAFVTAGLIVGAGTLTRKHDRHLSHKT